MDTTRRLFLAAGPAAAVFANLSAAALAAPGSDPAIAALAEYGRAGMALDAAFARTRAASAKLDAAREAIGIVTYHGEEFYTVASLDFQKGYRPRQPRRPEMEEMIADLEKGWAEMGLIEVDHEYETARAILLEREPAFDAAFAASGVRAAEAAEDEPHATFCDAERSVIAAKPTTRAGVAAQLRFIADNFEELIDDSRELAPDAIRAAADLLAADPAIA